MYKHVLFTVVYGSAIAAASCEKKVMKQKQNLNIFLVRYFVLVGAHAQRFKVSSNEMSLRADPKTGVFGNGLRSLFFLFEEISFSLVPTNRILLRT